MQVMRGRQGQQRHGNVHSWKDATLKASLRRHQTQQHSKGSWQLAHQKLPPKVIVMCDTSQQVIMHAGLIAGCCIPVGSSTPDGPLRGSACGSTTMHACAEQPWCSRPTTHTHTGTTSTGSLRQPLPSPPGIDIPTSRLLLPMPHHLLGGRCSSSCALQPTQQHPICPLLLV